MTRGESALHTRSTGHPEERPARALTDNAIYLHAAHGKEDKGKTRNSASTDLHSAQAAGACSLWTGLTPGGNASRGQEESAPERLCHTNVTHDLLSLTSWTQQRTISANRNEHKVCTHAREEHKHPRPARPPPKPYSRVTGTDAEAAHQQLGCLFQHVPDFALPFLYQLLVCLIEHKHSCLISSGFLREKLPVPLEAKVATTKVQRPKRLW